MGEAIGGKSIDLEWVQVHPTGLVKPDDPDAKIKFLAAEALRGVGGLVLDANGNRFANELGRRDYVTGEMWKNKPPFRLCLNKAAAEEIHWHCKHYTGRGVMKFYETGEALAKDMGVPLATLEATHDAHYQAAKKTEKDPDGGSWPAYPSGKSWDEASGKTGSGKKFYHNIIQGSAVKTEPFYVAIITPVIHYCMGGLEIDTDSAVVNADGQAIPGLYAAGEVAGGVHGNNRLGGNSLLDCVVFGRVAGKACCDYMLGGDVQETSLFDLSGGGLSAAAEEETKAVVPAKEKTVAKKEKKDKKPKASSGGGLTMEEVAKHVTKEDCWVVLNNKVLNVTSFLSQHPGGELAILTFAGKDATAEFDMIHPPDVVGKYAPDAIIGELGGAGGAEEESDEESEEEEEEEDTAGGGGYTVEEVAKHTTKEDCWVILHGRVLNVTSFLSQHPGGELAILTFAGKDATAEFDMIHPPDVVGKYAPDAIIGEVGAAKPKKAKKGGKKGGGGGGAKGDKGSKIANHQAWGTMEGADNWRVHLNDEPIGFLGFAWAYAYAGWSLLLSVLYETCATIFSATNIKITNDRVGLTRSAIFLIIFIIIHAVGNLHVFKGPDDFNGYGYFYVRLYWTGFGLPANIVEEYVLLSIMLHVGVGLKRTWDQKLALVKTQGLSVLNLAMTGLMLMTFMTIHLFQFRFGDTDQFGPYYIRPPPFMVNFEGILSLDLFWAYEGDVKVGVRDIYALEFQIFKNPVWSYFYVFSVLVFITHACLGWKKVTPVLVPKRHVSKSEHIGYALIIVVGLIYLSFPLYVALVDRFAGYETSLQVPANRDA
jgi:cytochrome b involved in lipid metabolism